MREERSARNAWARRQWLERARLLISVATSNQRTLTALQKPESSLVVTALHVVCDAFPFLAGAHACTAIGHQRSSPTAAISVANEKGDRVRQRAGDLAAVWSYVLCTPCARVLRACRGFHLFEHARLPQHASVCAQLARGKANPQLNQVSNQRA